MAARTHKIRHDDETRAKIQATQIINRLHGCVMGEITLDAQQVSSAKTLLNKVLPDLQSIEQNNTHDVSDPILELMGEIAANGRRIHDKS